MANIYRPPKKETKTLQLGKNTKVRVNNEIIKEFVTKIYEDPSAGVRELYANSVNACKIAKYKHGADPKIEIRMNLDNMKLEIIEHDSLGMTEDVFENIFTVLGCSGNFDGELPGQFGVGMMAYHTLSDTMLIETYARENDERFFKFGHGLDGFEDITAYNVRNEKKLEKYGSKFTLTLRVDPHEQNEHRYIATGLITVLEDCAMFSGIPTTLDIITKKHENFYATGIRVLGPIEPEEYLDNIDMHIDDEDYILDISHYDNSTKRICTLAGIPIEHGILPFLSYVLQVKNERKYRPTASRDILTSKARADLENKICVELVKRLGNKLGHHLSNWGKAPALATMLDEITGDVREGPRGLFNPKAKNKNINILNSKTLELLDALRNHSTIHYKYGTNNRYGVNNEKLVMLNYLITLFNSRDNLFNNEINAAISEGRLRCMTNAHSEIVDDYLDSRDDIFMVVAIPEGTMGEQKRIVKILNKAGMPELTLEEVKKNNESSIVSHYIENNRREKKRIFGDVTAKSVNINTLGDVKKVHAMMLLHGIENVKVHDNLDFGISIDEYYEKWANQKYAIEGGEISGNDIFNNPNKYILVNKNHLFLDNLSQIYKHALGLVLPTMILTDDENMNNMKAASMFKNNVPLNIFDNFEMRKLFKTIHGITIDVGAFMSQSARIVKLFRCIDDKNIKNTILRGIEKANYSRKLLKELNKTLRKYDGELDAYFQILKHIDDVKFNQILKSNFTAEINRIMVKKILTDAVEFNRLLKKYYFPYSENVEITRISGIITITVEMTAGKSVTEEDLNHLYKQTGLPSVFSSLTVSDDKRVKLTLKSKST